MINFEAMMTTPRNLEGRFDNGCFTFWMNFADEIKVDTSHFQSFIKKFDNFRSAIFKKNSALGYAVDLGALSNGFISIAHDQGNTPTVFLTDPYQKPSAITKAQWEDPSIALRKRYNSLLEGKNALPFIFLSDNPNKGREGEPLFNCGLVNSKNKIIQDVIAGRGFICPSFVWLKDFRLFLLKNIYSSVSCVSIGNQVIITKDTVGNLSEKDALKCNQGISKGIITLMNIKSKKITQVDLIGEGDRYRKFLSYFLCGLFQKVDPAVTVMEKQDLDKAIDVISAGGSIQDALFSVWDRAKYPFDLRELITFKGSQNTGTGIYADAAKGNIIVPLAQGFKRYTSCIPMLESLDKKGCLLLKESLDKTIASFTKYYESKGEHFICRLDRGFVGDAKKDFSAYTPVKFRVDSAEVLQGAPYLLEVDVCDKLYELEKLYQGLDKESAIKVTLTDGKVRYISNKDAVLKYLSKVAIKGTSVKAIMSCYVDSVKGFPGSEVSLDKLEFRALGLNRSIYRLVPYSVIQGYRISSIEVVPLTSVPTQRVLLNEEGFVNHLMNKVVQNEDTRVDFLKAFDGLTPAYNDLSAPEKQRYVGQFLYKQDTDALLNYANGGILEEYLADPEKSGRGFKQLGALLSDHTKVGFGQYTYDYMRTLLASERPVGILGLTATGGSVFYVATRNPIMAMNYYGFKRYFERLNESTPKEMTVSWVNKLRRNLKAVYETYGLKELNTALTILQLSLVDDWNAMEVYFDRWYASAKDTSKVVKDGDPTSIYFTVLDKGSFKLDSSIELSKIIKAAEV